MKILRVSIPVTHPE